MPHGLYFVTLCVEPRLPVLVDVTADAVHAELLDAEGSGIWQQRTFVIMPDHVHLLFRLGDKLTLSQAIARLKVNTRDLLGSRHTRWQQNFYDHKLRAEEPLEPVFRYIHQNPYAAGLIPLTEKWPHYFCCAEDRRWFEPLTDDGRPMPEWLR